MDETKSSANLNLECLICQQKFEKKSNLTRHLNTQKHKNRLNGFKCSCGKFYKHNSSYLRHLKTCRKHIEKHGKHIANILRKMAAKLARRTPGGRLHAGSAVPKARRCFSES